MQLTIKANYFKLAFKNECTTLSPTTTTIMNLLCKQAGTREADFPLLTWKVKVSPQASYLIFLCLNSSHA